MRVVEARVAGRRAAIASFGFGSDWYPACEGVVDEEWIDPVQRALDAALEAKVRPAIADMVVDASHAVIES